jgi:hypothetical protein
MFDAERDPGDPDRRERVAAMSVEIGVRKEWDPEILGNWIILTVEDHINTEPFGGCGVTIRLTKSMSPTEAKKLAQKIMDAAE